MSISAPAQVVSHVANAISGLFRRGTVASSTGLTDTTVSYGDQSYAVPTALVPFAIGEVPAEDAEVITAHINGQPVLLGKLARSGLTTAYSPIPVVSSLPTAGSGYRGVALRLEGGSGVADGVYVCVKGTSSYSWVRMDNASTSSFPLGVLGVANKTSTQSISSGGATITSLSVTATVGSSRRVKATITIDLGISSTTNGASITLLEDGSTVKSTIVYVATAIGGQTFSLVWSFTPSAGSHTYTVRGSATPNTLSVSSAQLMIEDVGVA